MKEITFFSIRQVIDLTGVSEFTIRGWENRYQAITPARTDKGRRLYTTDDLLKIKALKDLVDCGHQISMIANLSYAELQDLLTETHLPEITEIQNPEVATILEHAEKFSWILVQKIFHEQRKKLKNKEFIFQFILPLIKEINTLVGLDQFSIAREHILSAMIKEELYCLKNAHPPKKSKSRLIFATPENELHEIGILLSSTLANLSGKSNLYIGVNTPRQQVAEVCLRYEATHLVLSSTNLNNQNELLQFLHFLDKQLPKNISICMGGPVVNTLAIKLKREFLLFSSIEEIYSFFEKLK